MAPGNFRQSASTLIAAIETGNEWLGRSLGWLTLGMALTMFGVVVLRYGFAVGSIAWQESVSWMHGAVFMLGAAYTLQHGGHVRVDVFYQHWSTRRRAWVDLCGTLLLLWPVAGLLLLKSWDYVALSWSIHEASREVGGLPGLYLLKSIMPLAALLLILQGLTRVLRSLLVILYGAPDSPDVSAQHNG